VLAAGALCAVSDEKSTLVQSARYPIRRDADCAVSRLSHPGALPQRGSPSAGRGHVVLRRRAVAGAFWQFAAVASAVTRSAPSRGPASPRERHLFIEQEARSRPHTTSTI
jgi:hypothetical protein